MKWASLIGKQKSRKSRSVEVFLIVSLTIGLGLLNISNRSLTLDEVSTVTIASSWTSLSHVLWTEEGNMWFYYILSHILLNFLGSATIVIRGFSLLFAVLTIPAYYLLCRELVQKKVAIISTFLLSTNLYFIFYAQEARGYSLSLLLATVASYFFIKLLKSRFSKKYMILYVISIALSLYTSVLSGLFVAIQFLMMAVYCRPFPWKKGTLLVVAIVTLLLPLLLSPASHGHQVDWLQIPKWVYLPMGFTTLAGDSLAFSILSCMCISAFFWKERKAVSHLTKKTTVLLWLVLWTAFPILVGFFFSRFVKPIYEPESFNTSLPAFLLLFSIAIERIFGNHKKVYLAVLILTVTISAIRLSEWYTQSDARGFVFENKIPRNWNLVEKFLEQQSVEGDGVIFYAYYDRFPIEYYKEKSKTTHFPEIIEVSSSEYNLGGGTKLPDPDVSVLDSLSKKHDRVWLVLSYNDFTWLDRKKQWLEIEDELRKVYIQEKDYEFSQIEVKLYRLRE